MKLLDICLNAGISWIVSEIIVHKKLKWFLDLCINTTSERFVREDLKEVRRSFMLPWNDIEEEYDEEVSEIIEKMKRK